MQKLTFDEYTKHRAHWHAEAERLGHFPSQGFRIAEAAMNGDSKTYGPIRLPPGMKAIATTTKLKAVPPPRRTMTKETTMNKTKRTAAAERAADAAKRAEESAKSAVRVAADMQARAVLREIAFDPSSSSEARERAREGLGIPPLDPRLAALDATHGLAGERPVFCDVRTRSAARTLTSEEARAEIVATRNLTEPKFQISITMREEARTRVVSWETCMITGRPERTVSASDPRAIVKRYSVQPTRIVEDGNVLTNSSASLF